MKEQFYVFKKKIEDSNINTSVNENEKLIELMRKQNENLIQDNASKNKIIELLINNQHLLNKSVFENNITSQKTTVDEINAHSNANSSDDDFAELQNDYDSDTSIDSSSNTSTADTSDEHGTITNYREVKNSQRRTLPIKKKPDKKFVTKRKTAKVTKENDINKRKSNNIESIESNDKLFGKPFNNINDNQEYRKSPTQTITASYSDAVKNKPKNIVLFSDSILKNLRMGSLTVLLKMVKLT